VTVTRTLVTESLPKVLDSLPIRPYRGSMIDTQTLAESMERMKELSAGELAVMAGCGFPDSNKSIGALTLTDIRDAVVECVLGGWWTEDSAYEIADSAVSPYTHQMWLQFVDLTLYSSEHVDDVGDLISADALPALAIYKMALTLVASLAYRFNLEEV
jgi:hypothetical protein